MRYQQGMLVTIATALHEVALKYIVHVSEILA